MFGTGNRNETNRSILWENMDTSAGEISLDSQWATARGLPESTPFFWNNERSIYLVNAYHSLHCLVCTALASAFRLNTNINVASVRSVAGSPFPIITSLS